MIAVRAASSGSAWSSFRSLCPPISVWPFLWVLPSQLCCFRLVHSYFLLLSQFSQDHTKKRFCRNWWLSKPSFFHISCSLLLPWIHLTVDLHFDDCTLLIHVTSHGRSVTLMFQAACWSLFHASKRPHSARTLRNRKVTRRGSSGSWRRETARRGSLTNHESSKFPPRRRTENCGSAACWTSGYSLPRRSVSWHCGFSCGIFTKATPRFHKFEVR